MGMLAPGVESIWTAYGKHWVQTPVKHTHTHVCYKYQGKEKNNKYTGVKTLPTSINVKIKSITESFLNWILSIFS